MSPAAPTIPQEWIHRLEPPSLYGDRDTRPEWRQEALRVGPLLIRSAYMRQGRASYWHRPRHGVTWPGQGHRISWQPWCGSALSTTNGVEYAHEVPDDGRRVCGTCEGRAQGAGHPPVALAPMHGIGVVFSPRRPTDPPRTCPGSQSLACEELPYAKGHGSRGRCLVCGLTIRLRGHGGWLRSGYGMQIHAPGPGLVPGCEWHGWRRLGITADRRIVCAGCNRDTPLGWL